MKSKKKQRKKVCICSMGESGQKIADISGKKVLHWAYCPIKKPFIPNKNSSWVPK